MFGRSLSPVSLQFKIGDRIYELVYFHMGKSLVSGQVMLEQGERLDANMGREDGNFIFEHQEDIPADYRDRFILSFPKWLDPTNVKNVFFLEWRDGKWSPYWAPLNKEWYDFCRLVRLV